MTGFYAKQCQCGHKSCKNWHVSSVADVQGVSFTKDQAELVASVLNLASHPGYAPRLSEVISDMAIDAGLDR